MTIELKQAPEEVFIDAQKEGVETLKHIARSGEREVVPKAGFEPAHPCGR